MTSFCFPFLSSIILSILFCVSDILPPSFDVPCPASPLVAYAERETFSAEVNWTVPTATDNSGFKPFVNSNYHPPGRFRQGTYIITYSAADQSGNKATCSFTIEVIGKFYFKQLIPPGAVKVLMMGSSINWPRIALRRNKSCHKELNNLFAPLKFSYSLIIQFMCFSVINCTSLMVDIGGPLRMGSCGNHYGARCEFSCASGYRLNGSSDVTCVAQRDRPPGVWDNPVPTCQSKWPLTRHLTTQWVHQNLIWITISSY